MGIYVQKDGTQLGPFTEEHLRDGIANGDYKATTMAWKNGMAAWLPLENLLSPSAPPPLFPSPPPTQRWSLTPEDYRVPDEKRWLYICLSIFCVLVLAGSIFTGGVGFIVIFAIVILAIIGAIWSINRQLGHSIQVSNRQFPEVFAIVERAAHNLGMHAPKAFITQTPTLNAFATGLLGHKCIVLTTGIVDAMDSDELTAIVGHELSHLKCGHTFWTALTGAAGSVGIPFVAEFFNYIFVFWMRRSEFTCDRGGLIAGRNLKASASSLAKLASGKHLFEKLDLDAFLEQRQERSENELGRFTEVFSSHPAIVDRIHALKIFHESEQYQRITRG